MHKINSITHSIQEISFKVAYKNWIFLYIIFIALAYLNWLLGLTLGNSTFVICLGITGNKNESKPILSQHPIIFESGHYEFHHKLTEFRNKILK